MSNVAKTIKFVSTLAQNTNSKASSATITGVQLKNLVKSDLVARQNMINPREMGLSIATEAGKFQMSIDSGAMLAKSIKTGEVKTFVVEPGTVLKNVALGNFEVRDARVQPKHNFTKADPGMVNIFAHKGPDEPTGATGWGRK